ncbi:MAG: hypothetical protein WAN43_05525 [Rhodomicrobium sp.]
MHSQNSPSRPWAQTALGLPAVVVIGGVVAAMNWRFGQTLGHTELDGYLFGALGVALVALNWIMPGAAAFAASRRARFQQAAAMLLWIVCAAFTLMSSIGFSAMHRAENGAERLESAARYFRAKADHERLTGELAAMKTSPKYEAAAGCADAHARQATFCAAVKAKEAEIKAAKRDMDAGRPASVDPQAETLASLTGFEVGQVSTALAVSVAVVMELVSSLGFFAVAHAAPSPSANPSAAPQTASGSVISLKPLSAADVSAAAKALASRPRPGRRKKRLGAALSPPSATKAEPPAPRRRSRARV